MATQQKTKTFKKTNGDDLPAKPWRPAGHMEDNPVGLPADATEDLAKQLDRHLAAHWTMWHQYRKHHWLAVGPQFRQLHLFLEENYEEVAKQGDVIAERITLLGGIPTSGMEAQARLTYITMEPEGHYRVRDSLKHDMLCEQTMAINLRMTITEANKQGDFGSEQLLKKALVKCEDRAHHIEHFLEGDSLEIGREEK